MTSAVATKPPEPFVDIHCHLLPGLDDGAATLDEAIAMAATALADGIETIVATPHQMGPYMRNSGAAIVAAVGQFQAVLDQRGLPLRVLPGADVRIVPELTRKIRTGDILTIANRRRHVLLELPHDVFIPFDGVLAELRAAGVAGILSHPERNQGIRRQPESLRALADAGCLLQVTAMSLTGGFGREIQRFSEWMLGRGLVHFVSTDAHETRHRTAVLRGAFDRVVALAGRETAVRLCCRNPAAVAAGCNLASPSQQHHVPTWRKWLRQTFVPEPCLDGR
jgi:protein-tyrosine phosphatase